MPASTSLRTAIQVSLSLSLSVCSSITYSARSSDMPDEIIVESWRVAIVRSPDLIRRKLARMSVALLGMSSSMSTTIRPLERSWEATACLSLPSISPRVGTPARSSALKVKLAIVL